MNNNLRNLQSSIQIALDDPQVTPGQIAETVRATLEMEYSKARDAATKADAALFSFGPRNDDITFSSDTQAAQPLSSIGIYGGRGTDVISF